jgi:hypothetical protein
LAVLAIALIGIAGAANYMYEKASVEGVGYKNVEMIISTQTGFNGQKLVEKESGSGNVITERTELEAERQLTRGGDPIGSTWVPEKDAVPLHWINIATGEISFVNPDIIKTSLVNPDIGEISPCKEGWTEVAETPAVLGHFEPICQWPTGQLCPMDYINFSKEAEFEYMPVSYQTGTYDQKWVEKLCVQNYRIGAVLTEMYTHAEHLQKTTEVKTRGYSTSNNGCPACCTGVLEANLNSNVIGVAHIGWISRDPSADNQLKGRHAEYGRSVEDLTGVFSIEKFIQLWGNSTCGAISVDWLPCV